MVAVEAPVLNGIGIEGFLGVCAGKERLAAYPFSINLLLGVEREE